MALDAPGRPNSYRSLELGERIQLPPNHEAETFDLSTLIKGSLEEGKVFRLQVRTGLSLNALKVVVIKGGAFVIQADGSFDRSAHSSTHTLSVDSRNGTLLLKPMVESNFASIESIVVANVDEQALYAVKLEEHQVTERQWETLGKGVRTVVGAAALAAALCGGAAYLLDGDSAEETQKAEEGR